MKYAIEDMRPNYMGEQEKNNQNTEGDFTLGDPQTAETFKIK